MAAVLVTLATARMHLRIPATDTTFDADIQVKLDQAEAIILDYLDTSADPLWVSPATAPGQVTAAILLAMGDLFEHRGDEAISEDTWTAIARILARSRNAALA